MTTHTDPWAKVNTLLATQRAKIEELTGIFTRANAQIVEAAEVLNRCNRERLQAQLERDQALQALEALRRELEGMRCRTD